MLNDPRNDFASGVRELATTTASLTVTSPWLDAYLSYAILRWSGERGSNVKINASAAALSAGVVLVKMLVLVVNASIFVGT
jgi:hypothetical protein